jgi:hypothetical protein
MEAFVPRVQIWLYSRLQTALFDRICLALSHVVNAITSWIWGVSCCMSARLYTKGCGTQWTTPCLSLSPGEIVEVISLAPRHCLVDSTFGNLISSSFVIYGVCMPIDDSAMCCRAPWSTPSPKLSSGEFAMAVATRLIEHKSGQTSFDSESWK